MKIKNFILGSIFLLVLFLVGCVPTTIVTPYSNIPGSESKLASNTVTYSYPGGSCITDDVQNLASQTFGLSSGIQVGAIYVTKNSQLIKSSDCDSSLLKQKINPSTYIEYYCVTGTTSVLVKREVDTETTSGNFYLDFPQGCDNIKVQSYIDAHLIDRSGSQTSKAVISQNVILIPKTYRKQIDEISIASPKSIVCDNKYEYCSFATTYCQELKDNTEKTYTCDTNNCLGTYAKQQVTYTCNIPVVGKEPKMILYGHSYSPLCTSGEICSIGSKQCTNQQPQVCADSNNDNCGDSWTNVGSACIGNYECKDGACICKPDITCSNGKTNGEEWCSGSERKKCTVNQASCSAKITTVETCSSIQKCEESSPTSTFCNCDINSCSDGTSNGALTCSTGDVKRCNINSVSCSESLALVDDCVAGIEVCDDFTKSCVCDTSAENYCTTPNVIKCDPSNDNKMLKCTKTSPSADCYSWTPYASNQYPLSQKCVGNTWQCRDTEDLCTDNTCWLGDKIPCLLPSDNNPNCKHEGLPTDCGELFSCSYGECIPQHQCDTIGETRCLESNSRDIEECKLINNVKQWVKVYTCSVGEMCVAHSPASCTEAYVLSIQAPAEGAVGVPISDITVSVKQDLLPVTGKTVQVCLETTNSKCESPTAQVTYGVTGSLGNTQILSFNPQATPGSLYLSAYIIEGSTPEAKKEMKDATIITKEIKLKRRMDLSLGVGGTAFVNSDIRINFEVHEINPDGTLGTIIPITSLDNVLIQQGSSVLQYSYVQGQNALVFITPTAGEVSYTATAKYNGYIDSVESGSVSVSHPTLVSSLLIDGKPYDTYKNKLVDPNTYKITLSVLKGSNYLRLQTDNIRIRSPSQAPGEGSKLIFSNPQNKNIYEATYNFNEPSKTYYIEGQYTVIDTQDIIVIGTLPFSIGGAPVAEEWYADPFILGGIALIFVTMIVISVILIRRRR